MNLEKCKKNFLLNELYLCEFATKSSEAIRLNDISPDIRPAYFRDIDRIIHSLSYTRYIGKTQVFSFKENDNISQRMIHVQLVSKIARTIGRALRLNCDLIEAISLGHDIGHPPLGHNGEAILNEIALKELNECFLHNIQSVRYYLEIEKGGQGSNLTIQTLDGIMCHNGEEVLKVYEPVKKTKQEFLTEYKNSFKSKNISLNYRPMTLEACVVKISDVIAYVGRDIEDAINMDLLQRSKLPKNVTKVLGNTNTDIVNTVILDIIEESMDKPYIKMSDKVYKALKELKEFNLHNIYIKSSTPEEMNNYKKDIYMLYNIYLNDLNTNNTESIIYTLFLNDKNNLYKENNNKRIVIDFICGMTDDFFKTQVLLNVKKEGNNNENK